MSAHEVCRLCLSKNNLLFVFDKRVDKLKDVILITTGVEIHSEDVISQKICLTCSQDAVKMYQFRQQSLKIDKYLKAQYRELLKHTDSKISRTNVTSKLKRINIEEEKKEEPSRTPPYRVHPTIISLSRKYPNLQFPSICVLFNVDPCVCLEMDTVENYFKSRNLNMKKYAQLSLAASNRNIPSKSSTIMKSSEKNTECSVEHVAQSTKSTVSETVDNSKVVNKVKPINIKLNPSGYSIVRPSTENIIHGEDKYVFESTSLCKQLIPDSPESKSVIRRPHKRRLSDSDLLSEPEIKKLSSANPSKMISVLSNIEIKSPSVFKCNMCSSIQFSAKHLKKHQIRHLRCKFCKIQFKSVGMKQQHVKHSCLVKEALDNCPDVEVERIELNMNVRLHHQDAFGIFPPPPGFERLDSAPISSEASDEIIQIISDDEDTPVPTMISSKSPSLTPSTVTPTFHRNPALIRPDVGIKNDNISDTLKTPSSDLGIIKELLTKFKNLKSVTDEATQIERPRIESIRIDEENLTTELINVKQVLHSYKLPVRIRKGSKMSASFNYQRTQPKPKSLKLWTDLTPIDVETENNSITNSEHVTAVTPATHSSIFTNNADLVGSGKSGDYSSNDHTSLQNIGIVIPMRSNGFNHSSNSLQTESSTLITTPDCLNIVQAEPLTTFPTQFSSNTEMQNGKNLLVSPHALEICQVEATSPATDIPNIRHSPTKSSVIVQTGNNPNFLEVNSVQTVTNTPSGRISSGADQTTLQNPTSCAQCYVNSASYIKSSVQDNTDMNTNWSLLNSHSEVVGSTRQDSADETIEYVVNNYSRSLDTSLINVCPANGLIYSNNNQQSSSHISQARPNNTMIQWNLNVHQHFETATTNYHNMNIYFERSLSYPNCSTVVNQTPQSYISSHTSNIAHAVDNAKVVQTVDGNYDAFLQCSRVQEFTSFQPVVTYTPNASLNSEVHHLQTDHSSASKSLRRVLPRPRVSESFGFYGNELSIALPHYSEASNYVNGSSTVSTGNQNLDVSNTMSAAWDTVPSDKSQHFPSGLIRVRNVLEMT